jgi:DEAD/DEAH box helicase
MIENEAAVLKAAKRYLQKEESGALKLKELAKTVVSDLLDKKVNDDANDKTTKKQTKQVRAWIEQSSKFEVHKKMVSLKSKDKNNKDEKSSSRKRTISPETPSADDKASSSSSSSSSSKKSKKNNSGSGSSNNTQKEMNQWRIDNKIVLLDYTQQDEQGQLLSKQHNENADFYPWTSFEHASAATCIDAALIRQCTGAGNKFLKPSPIQSQAWPILTSPSSVNGSSGRDIVGIAETGSGTCNNGVIRGVYNLHLFEQYNVLNYSVFVVAGKTLAFALPALSAMAREDRSSNSSRRNSRRLPRMLVLSPTRELAMQSDVVLQEFGAVVQLSSLVIYGGVPKFTQTNELKRGNVDCIVATPGRLKDLIQQGSCDLSQISQLVLDEADRM